MAANRTQEPTFFKGKQIFYSVLNMGLGHATRSLPIILALRSAGAEVTIGSSGRALMFLRQEVPDAQFLELPDYRLQYGENGVSLLGLFLQLPTFFRQVKAEKDAVQAFCRSAKPDMIISDHRYGSFSPDIPSLFLCHQIRFIAPDGLQRFEFVGEWFNRAYFRNFHAVLIPDIEDDGMGYYSGRLSKIKGRNGFYRYIGILSSLPEENGAQEDIDVLISISGPEPQRTVFEKIVREQLPEVSGRVVVLLGKPEGGETGRVSEKVTIYPHLSRQRMAALVRRSRLVVSRSGYSTVMELAALGKKALLVPTPGQTEQEYLARHLAEKGLFFWQPQNKLRLKEDIHSALAQPGPEKLPETRGTVKNVLEILGELLGKNAGLKD